MSRALLFIFLFTLNSLIANAQGRVHVTGKWYPAVMGDTSIIYSQSTIYLQNTESGRLIISKSLNQKIDFSAPAGSYSLQIEAGKKSFLTFITLHRDTAIELKLVSAIAIDEVAVTSQYAPNAGKAKLTMKQVHKIPNLMGEPDPMRALQYIPGVLTGGEGSSGYFVRGGSMDQNLFLWDDAPIYNVSHMFGLLSVFNGDAVQDLTVYKGGFPAQYGGRLSSIMDINARQGNHDSAILHGSIGIIDSRLTYETPFAKGRGSILAGGRRTYFDIFTQLINRFKTDHTTDIPTYNFYDLNLKVDYRLSESKTKPSKFSLTMYNGDDHLKIYTDGLNYKALWGNTVGSINWDKVFGKISTRMNIYSTYYRYSIETTEQDYDLKLQSAVHDYGLNDNWNYKITARHSVNWGLQLIHHSFDPQTVSADVSAINLKYSTGQHLTALEGALYAGYTGDIAERWKLQAGIRFTNYLYRDKLRIYPEPRLLLGFALDDHTELTASYSRMTQCMHLVSNGMASFPTDIWYPATIDLQPQTADQYSAGIKTRILRQFALTDELFYKQMHHVVEYAEGADIFYRQNYEEEMVSGNGWSYGNEFSISKTKGRLTGALAYTLSWSLRQFEAKNFGNPYFANADRRHYISLNADYRINKRWTIDAGWIFASGQPVSLPVGRVFLTNAYPNIRDYFWIYGPLNTIRLSPFHHLDISVKYKFKCKLTNKYLSFGCYNIYNRKNIYYLFIQRTTTDNHSERFETQRVSLLPIIPFFSFNFIL